MVFEKIPSIVGMVYAITAFFILAYLFYKNKLNKKVGYLFLLISTIFGFMIFAPMFPNQIQLLAVGDTSQLGGPAQIVGLILLLFIVLTFVFGRIFCGYLCPIGAVQELAYNMPVKKLKLGNKKLSIVFHLLFFLAFIVLSVVFSIKILAYFGFRDFFYLNVMSLFFYAFLILLILSVFVYRPFCRFFCPYGAVLSLVSIKSIFKFRRKDNCIDFKKCKACEKECPTNEAGRSDLKQECYLCSRCRYACPVDAIGYNINKKEAK